MIIIYNLCSIKFTYYSVVIVCKKFNIISRIHYFKKLFVYGILLWILKANVKIGNLSNIKL